MQSSDVNRKQKNLEYQENITNTKEVFGISALNFLVFSQLVFYRYLEYDLHKIWLTIGISRKNKKYVWYLVSVAAISLVSVWFWLAIFLKMASPLQCKARAS